MTGLPPLARSGVDRAALRRGDPQWLADAWKRARVVVIDPNNRVLCTSQPALVFSDPAGAGDVPEPDRLFLGVDLDDDTPYFAVVADQLPEPPANPPGTQPATLRQVGAALPARDAGLFVTAAALANWHATHRYSPVTGEPTTVADGGWLRRDRSGTQLFPRTDPAIIVLVHDGVAGPDGRCLLGNNAAWSVREDGRRFFSTLAGFVEPGESAEAAVVREIHEEVGVVVSDLRYQGSQGWPFPGSLMLGFTGYADPAQPLRPEPSEIADARWFTRTEITALVAAEPDPVPAPGPLDRAPRSARLAGGPVAPSGLNVTLPGAASIARYLINTWLHDSRRP